MKLVECVPNFSEGQNLDIINKITDEIKGVDGCTLLDVDPGKTTNRTVVTFVGTPEAVVNAAFLAIKKGSELIDMSKHKGAHPRQGACDVCPLVPVSDVTIEECVEFANMLAKRVGEELSIPVYMYEYAATKPEWKNLAIIREGEYEALAEKLKKPEWKPDYGPAKFNAKSGATVIGVRDFLIAYNINLNTTRVKNAKDIANKIREKGYPKRDEKRRLIKDNEGNIVWEPGLFKYCKATGWFIEEFGCAQITMNLTRPTETKLHEVFDTVCKLASEKGLRVTGSEVVGLIPLEAMLEAGKYFLKKQNSSLSRNERDIIHHASLSLGLNDVARFDMDEKIIEYKIASKGKLVSMNVSDFIDETSSDSPAPGGGSVSALSASLAAALSSMVALLSYPKRKLKKWRPVLEQAGQKAQALKAKFATTIDKDTEAFNTFIAALRMPHNTEEQKQQRSIAMKQAQLGITQVPFSLLETICTEMPAILEPIIDYGFQKSLSDIGVAVIQAKAGAQGAYLNVLINLSGFDESDSLLIKDFNEKADKLLKQGTEAFDRLYEKVRKQLENHK